MKNILITGSRGQLGLELQKQLKGKYDITAADIPELDITDEKQISEKIDSLKPDIIINAAAFTAVDLCETEQDAAYKVNAIGAKNLAMAAKKTGAKLVHISTDYVFDGENTVPYIETDATNPQSVYGSTKLAGEKFVTENTDKYFIIRTAWLYGEGKNFVRTMINLSQSHDSVKVVNDQTGSPTSTKELAHMITALMETDKYGIYHGTCEGYCTWYEFTCEIFRLKNINTPVYPITTAEMPRPAHRPKYSVLENHELKKTGLYTFKHWKEALEEYLK